MANSEGIDKLMNAILRAVSPGQYFIYYIIFLGAIVVSIINDK